MAKDEEAGISNGPSQPPYSSSLLPSKKIELHPAFYVAIWIFFSGSVILFNKWVLDTAGFRFPIFLTTWHLVFATVMTQILARTTHLLDGLKTVKMDGRTYVRAILPVGVFFSLSLICSNQAYLYLSVAFIQMLKATTPVAVLVTTWAMQMEPVNLKVLGNVSFIVVGIIIASYGEIAFVFVGFVFQAFMIIFESIRLCMVQKLLSSPEYKMDPLVSLYYFAPVCAVMNGVCCIIFEGSTLSVKAVTDAGLVMLFMNAAVAFCLNVAVVFLIGKTSSLVLTLSGVLKDILLVSLSVIIWSTPVTALQMFGYAIALGGLIWYKLGGEQAQAAYLKLAGDENSTFNRFRRSLWAKIGAGLLGVFVFLAVVHGFVPRGQGMDTASTKTGLSGAPEPEMVDAYNGAVHEASHAFESWDTQESTSTHHAGNVPTRALDIIIYHPSPAGKHQLALSQFKPIFTLDSIAALSPNIISYSDDQSLGIEVSQSVTVGTIKSASAAYLHYISNHYDSLPEHTVFLHTDVDDASHISSVIANRFQSRTGVVELSPTGYGVCNCMDCKSPFSPATPLEKTDQLHALTSTQICSSTDKLLLSQDALFIASAKRIRRNPKSVYNYLLSTLDEDPSLEKTIASSWLYMLGCNDITISTKCTSAAAKPEDCQCID